MILKCPEDDKTYKSYGGWYVHNKKFHAGQLKPLNITEQERDVFGPSPVDKTSLTAPAPSLGEAKEGFYPPLADFKPTTGPPPKGEGVATAPSPVPVAAPAVMDTSGWWLTAGELIDNSILKKKKVKVNMTDAKAKALNTSLQNMGLTVTAPEKSISIPYWTPFLITIFSVFLLPIVLAFVPDILGKLGKKKKKEEVKEEGEQ